MKKIETTTQKYYKKRNRKLKKYSAISATKRLSLPLNMLFKSKENKRKKLNAFEKIFDLYKLKNKRNIIYIYV